jgi:O-succinylbenzoic acid--CoA ligase
MPTGGEASLIAIVGRGTAGATAIARAWDRGDAVAPLDPRLPPARRRAVLDQLRATHVDDGAGPQPLPGGAPVPATVGAVVSTSGTTGDRKGVQLEHAALAASAHAVHSAIGLEPRDTWLCCLPLHTVAGLAILYRSRVAETPLVVHDGFAPDAVGHAPEDGATLVSLVATMLARLLERAAPVERFRAVLLGGGPAPPDLVDAATWRGAHIATTYGQTETGGGCVHNGRPLPGVEVTLGDGSDSPASGSPAPGSPASGEILVRGPVVMRGYHRDAAATSRAFTTDGRLRTGDVGAFGDDGRLRVIDRLRDIVITGGVNVSPTAVERALLDHPDVADVCITGAYDAEWGERVVAHVVPAHAGAPPSLAALRDWGRDRLTPAELPRELRLVETIPRTPAGKPRRAELRDDKASRPRATA